MISTHIRTALGGAFAALTLAAMPAAAFAQSNDALVRAALQAAPEESRDGATVIAFDGKVTTTLKEGNNGLICLAPDPEAERFNAACYHESMEPYMARGRELRVEGVGDAGERNRIRWEEADAGTLPMPEMPASLYVLAGDADVWNPATGEVNGAFLRYVVYTPWATGASTGLSEVPITGAPWIMFPGTPGAHIMITPPRP